MTTEVIERNDGITVIEIGIPGPQGPPGTLIEVAEDGVVAVTPLRELDFRTGFDVTNPATRVSQIDLDLSEVSAGGELAGTLDSPTVDASHSGSTHQSISDALNAHEIDVVGAHAASAVAFTPTGTITSADTQSAVVEALTDARTYTDDGHVILSSRRGANDGVAELDSTGKVPSAELPAFSLGQVFTVASEAAMLALVATQGDMAVRTDVSETFILADDPATVLGNWVELLNPGSPVTSVNTRTGSVTGLEETSNKGAISGYAALDGSGTVPDAQIPAAIARDSEVTTAVANHAAAGDPHPTYETSAEAQAKVDTGVSTAESYAASQDAAHVAAGDPHPTYDTGTEAQARVDAGVSTATAYADTKDAAHVAASDPHPTYETSAEAAAKVTAHAADFEAHSPWYVDIRKDLAVGDGSADDFAEIAATIARAPAGSEVRIPVPSAYYKVTDEFVIDKPLRIVSDGAKLKQVTSGKKLFKIQSSGVTLEGLYAVGPRNVASMSYVNAERAVHIVAPSWAAAYEDIQIRNCEIEGWGGFGIYAQWVIGLTVKDGYNYVHDIGYAAIDCESVWDANITAHVKNVTPGTISNAYGISFSRLSGDVGELTTAPRSKNCYVTNSTVEDIPIWHGLDGHAPDSCHYKNNIVLNCYRGIAVGSGKNSAGVYAYAPLSTEIAGNTFDSLQTNGSRGEGISFTATGTEKATGTLSNNNIRNHGLENDGSDGGIIAYNTQGLKIIGGLIDRCSSTGISLRDSNFGFSVVGVTIQDAWSNSTGNAQAIKAANNVRGDNIGYVGGNSLVRGDLTGKTHIMSLGIRVNDSVGNALQVGENYIDSAVTTPRSDPGARITSPSGGGGVTSFAKSGATALTGAVTISGGANVTLTQTGQDVSIAANAGVATSFLSTIKWGD